MSQSKKSTQHTARSIQHNSNKFLYWLPAILYMLLIFILSSFPAPEPLRKVPIIYDIKLVHIVEYGVLSLLYTFALQNTTTLNYKQILWTSVFLTVAYGITDEIHQYFVPQRTCKLSDVLGNLLGALLFQWCWTKFRHQKT
jgi:VanZ family protein